jgi:spermidine/putrescine-binding protein
MRLYSIPWLGHTRDGHHGIQGVIEGEGHRQWDKTFINHAVVLERSKQMYIQPIDPKARKQKRKPPAMQRDNNVYAQKLLFFSNLLRLSSSDL